MADIPNTDGGEDGGNSAPTVEAGNKAPVPKDAGTDSESNADDEEDGDDDEGEEKTPTDDGSEPSTRRDPSYFIGLRKGKKAAKQQQQRKADQEDDGDGDDEEDGKGDDADDLEGAISKAIKPIADKIMTQEDKAELSSFISENPVFKPYKAKIERYMKHPSRSHLPIVTVAMEAVGAQEMLRIGAKLARSADTKKIQSKGGSQGGRTTQTKTNVWELPKEDFQKMQDRVRHGAR